MKIWIHEEVRKGLEVYQSRKNSESRVKFPVKKSIKKKDRGFDFHRELFIKWHDVMDRIKEGTNN